MTPRFFAATRFLELALSSLTRVGSLLRIDGAERQHPLYYRTNQFWRQLDEFRTDLRHAAEGALPEIRGVDQT